MKTIKELILAAFFCVALPVMIVTLPLWGGIYLLLSGKTMREIADEANNYGME